MRKIRTAVCALMVASLFTVAGCGASVHVNDKNATVKVPPGQVQKQLTPGHNR